MKLSLHQLLIGLLLPNIVLSQVGTDISITLKSAIEITNENYHSLRARDYEAQAALKNVDVAKYMRVPTIDATYQANIATANNITGMFFPYGILPITGPPSSKNSFTPVTGSAAGILLNWQAITFGQQEAQINVSLSEANSKKLNVAQERFRNTINVISKYLDVALAFDRMHIQEQNIRRVEINLKQSNTLATTGLRPGVDTAFFLSELSKAKIEWLNAKRQLENEQWLLAQFMVTDVLLMPTDTLFLDKLPSFDLTASTSFDHHPYVQYSQSLLDVSRSKEQFLKKNYLPRVNVFGVAFSRGSGIQADGEIKTFDGLGFTRYNYGAGVQIVFPIMKYGETKRQLLTQNLLSRAAQETVSQTSSELLTQQHLANAAYTNSLSIAAETQQQLKSAQYAFNAIQIRYSTGLVSLSDVVQIQYNLLRAELDVKNAYWNVWKALLLQAAVRGDLGLFLNEIK